VGTGTNLAFGHHPVELFFISLLNGLSYGLMLFMLSAGLTLIFGMLGVLNFAHAGFYMLGAYIAYTLSNIFGYWPSLILAPIAVGAIGLAFEFALLRRLRQKSHFAKMLATFGLSVVILEAVQLFWGAGPLNFSLPESLNGPAFALMPAPHGGLDIAIGGTAAKLCGVAATTSACIEFPMVRCFLGIVAIGTFTVLWLLLRYTGLGPLLRATLANSEMVEALGHNVPLIHALVFAGGTALAGLAGAIGGSAFGTEPAMAASVGSIVFVVVIVGGLGSLPGAFFASLLIGLLQTFAVNLDLTTTAALQLLGLTAPDFMTGMTMDRIKLAQFAPVVPFLLMLGILILRPQGLLGVDES
jgi:branched-chain amino acid transport system permease protein